jgi:hypothetical protein
MLGLSKVTQKWKGDNENINNFYSRISTNQKDISLTQSEPWTLSKGMLVHRGRLQKTTSLMLYIVHHLMFSAYP